MNTLYLIIGALVILVIYLYSSCKKQINDLQLKEKNAETALFSDTKEHSQEIKELKGKVYSLTELVNSLNRDTKQLKEENKKLKENLAELQKKINFYADIKEESANLNVSEDKKEQERLLNLAAQEVLGQQGKASISASNVIENSVSSQKDNSTPSVNLLDHEQSVACERMNYSMENIFITGKAGTGKSFLLNLFRKTTSKKHVVLAPTGIAALNVSGATLHSVFGYSNLASLDVDDISEATIRLKSEKILLLQSVQTIIIDEISMVRADTFDKIDRILKVLNHNNQPFGGKQMLIFGDLFQLPPVTKSTEMNYLLDRYGGVFFFNSDAYKHANFKFVELTINHRQKGDQKFFEILNRIREGAATEEDINVLNSRVTNDETIYDRFTTLLPTKAEAERVNREHVNQIGSREYVYEAKVKLDRQPGKTKNIENVFPIVSKLSLRRGALVMMVANDPTLRWVNGTLGIVDSLGSNNITVAIDNRIYDVTPMEFKEQEAYYDQTKKKISYEDVFSVVQYPLVPAYAITIHKSQGQTYKNIVCDIDQCFASGQAYVALSRCASLEGLHLKNRITGSSIKVDRGVLDFYRSQLSNAKLPSNAVPNSMQKTTTTPIASPISGNAKSSYGNSKFISGFTKLQVKYYGRWREATFICFNGPDSICVTIDNSNCIFRYPSDEIKEF